MRAGRRLSGSAGERPPGPLPRSSFWERYGAGRDMAEVLDVFGFSFPFGQTDTRSSPSPSDVRCANAVLGHAISRATRLIEMSSQIYEYTPSGVTGVFPVTPKEGGR